MKIAVVGWQTDVDADILKSCNDNDIETEWLMLGPKNPYNAYVMGSRYDIATPERIEKVINDSSIDLFIYKYPFWLDQYPQLKAIIQSHPVIAWQTELGPTCHFGVQYSAGFHTIGVNSRYEMQAYEKAYPNAKVLYFPFGCCKWDERDLRRYSQYTSDRLIADGSCHYACGPNGQGCEGGWKHISCDTMIAPVAHLGLAVYGNLFNLDPPYGDGKHGWEASPWKAMHAGVYDWEDYHKIYSSAKVYLGITFNWKLGGFGVKLPRAMSCGIPVLWHKTIGLELDGFRHAEHYLACATPEDTLSYTKAMLSNPDFAQEMGERGKEFVLQNFQYCDIISRVVDNMYS